MRGGVDTTGYLRNYFPFEENEKTRDVTYARLNGHAMPRYVEVNTALTGTCDGREEGQVEEVEDVTQKCMHITSIHT